MIYDLAFAQPQCIGAGGSGVHPLQTKKSEQAADGCRLPVKGERRHTPEYVYMRMGVWKETGKGMHRSMCICEWVCGKKQKKACTGV